MRKLALMLVAVACVLPFNLRSHSQSTAKNRISIVISAKQATFKVGDPIILQIIVKNISEYQYCEHNRVETDHAEWNGYDVVVKDAGGNEVPRISIAAEKTPRTKGKQGAAVHRDRGHLQRGLNR